ncbi:hypothetical protein CGCF415_v012013 [Colletotrichum fructicola]|uniref:uncharacterized protein n=1 Tax=Colletotrichum aenigma TaxID=1215731 RepID=UPI001872899B|nr:uncharacterized protein CGCA056_v011829 [Colletotrichum aenigma]KAF4895137.1 hypothetical protein CGCF415_v012013 [Colletotrichum fructicola]KAF5512794.1 hypothetical protein CGCA056_v011829 [Colletotrichum aenigma]
MDDSQMLREYYTPPVRRFIEAILLSENTPKSHFRYLTTVIVGRLSAGDTIRKIGLLVYSEQHRLSDLMKPRWRWLNIHSHMIESYGMEDAVSTETALLKLWKAMIEVTENDDDLTTAWEFALDNFDDTKELLDAAELDRTEFLSCLLSGMRI